MHDRSDEIVTVGPAGTGKSYGALFKIHFMCLLNGKCPPDCARAHEHHTEGMRALMVRKVHKSLTSTGLVTFREKVAGDAIAKGLCKWYGGSAERPAQYIYENGSSIVVGGLDNPDKIMSADYDVIFVQEATDLTLNDWEALTTRLRNGRVSFQQLLADCNPQQPTHWLKKRCDDGGTVMLYSRHEDNPTLFDDDGTIKPAGTAYMKKLDALTGVRKERLRHGRWAAAEGIIYEQWRPEIHIVNRDIGTTTGRPLPLPKSWRRVWGVDFGFTNPFVWQQWAIDPDGRLWLEHEIYWTQRLVEDHVKEILKVVRRSTGEWLYPKPSAIICDHDAEDRATLERHLGMGTRAAFKSVSRGIEAMATRLKVAGDGRPRLVVLSDSLVARDPALADAGKPTCFKEEIEGYIWKPKIMTGVTERPEPDEPLKLHDHSMDTGRYVVAWADLAPRPRVRWA